MRTTESVRTIRRYTQHIDAPPERVLPLLCPVREAEWLDGWGDICEILHSESGLVEEGCVFRTTGADGVETIWMTTRLDPAEGIVEFVRVTPGLVATHLRLRVEPAADASSLVHVTYTHTPLGAKGSEFVAVNHSEEEFVRGMLWWEKSMNHWLRTGETLRH